MRKLFIGLRTVPAEPKTLHQHLLELDPTTDLNEHADGEGFVMTNDEGQAVWIPAEIWHDTFRASAEQIDQDAVWKAVRDVVEPAESKPVPTGPRVTLDGIMAKVKGEEFHKIGDRLTLCILTLENGFVVTGESICVSAENYNEALGQKIAKDNALEKIWPLEGYLLRERLYRDAGRNRSIARLCYEIHRAHALDRAKMRSEKYEASLDDAFEKAPGGVQEEYMLMVETLRKDPEASTLLGDGLGFSHIFRAVVGALA
jgi:hypothetical protein